MVSVIAVVYCQMKTQYHRNAKILLANSVLAEGANVCKGKESTPKAEERR
jgi:hypothetical protein